MKSIPALFYHCYYSDSSSSSNNSSQAAPTFNQSTISTQSKDSPPSPVISRRMKSSRDAHEDFYMQTPKRPRTDFEQDSLSPRLGLLRQRRDPQPPVRFPQTKCHTPISKLGDLRGNPTFFVALNHYP